MIEGKDFIEAYIKWFREGVRINDTNGYTEITTPFLDSHNDMIQIYVKQDDNSLILSDDGWTIRDLKSNGCDMKNPRRKAILDGILNRLGVSMVGDELVVKTGITTFPQKKQALIQAILSVSDMMMVSGYRVANLFMDDVFKFLETNRVRASRDIQLLGKSGLSHRFDIIIPPTNISPETIIQTVNNPDKNSVQLTLFEWSDTKVFREDKSRLFVFLNDQNKPVTSSLRTAFAEYEIEAYTWTERNRALERLRSA
jgi:hypothetical protein